MKIVYSQEPALTAAEFIAILERSTLAERRPVREPERIERMLREASLILTARDGERLVGVSRALTDFSWCTYLSDLAVDAQYQRQGIGKRLIEETHVAAGKGTLLLLLAAPGAREYYPLIGMQFHDSCWTLPRTI